MYARSPEISDGSRASSLVSVVALGCAMGMYSATCSYPPFLSLTTLCVPIEYLWSGNPQHEKVESVNLQNQRGSHHIGLSYGH